jgi:hypothetical protein
VRIDDSLATKLYLVVFACESFGFVKSAKQGLAGRHYQAELGNELKIATGAFWMLEFAHTNLCTNFFSITLYP